MNLQHFQGVLFYIIKSYYTSTVIKSIKSIDKNVYTHFKFLIRLNLWNSISCVNYYIYIYKRLCYSCCCLPHPASHPFLFSQSACCRCLCSISTYMFSLQVLLGLPLFLLLSRTQSSILLGHRSAGILWTWPYHMSIFILTLSPP